MYQHTKLPAYLPMPRFLMNFPISNTAKLLYTQLLIIDDLGVESHSEYRMEGLFNVIDRRVRSGKPIIITTNLTMKEMDETQDLNEARIYDRIRAVCQPVQVKGESQRKANRGKMMDKFREIFTKTGGEEDDA